MMRRGESLFDNVLFFLFAYIYVYQATFLFNKNLSMLLRSTFTSKSGLSGYLFSHLSVFQFLCDY